MYTRSNLASHLPRPAQPTQLHNKTLSASYHATPVSNASFQYPVPIRPDGALDIKPEHVDKFNNKGYLEFGVALRQPELSNINRGLELIKKKIPGPFYVNGKMQHCITHAGSVNQILSALGYMERFSDPARLLLGSAPSRIETKINIYQGTGERGDTEDCQWFPKPLRHKMENAKDWPIELLIFLTDFDPQNGALILIPGSHIDAGHTRSAEESHEEMRYWPRHEIEAMISQYGVEVPAGKAGSGIFLNRNIKRNIWVDKSCRQDLSLSLSTYHPEKEAKKPPPKNPPHPTEETSNSMGFLEKVIFLDWVLA